MKAPKPSLDSPIPRKKNDIITKAAFVEWFIDLLRFLYPDADEVFNLGHGVTAMEKELLEITGQIVRFIRFLNNLIYLKDKELNLNFVRTVERLTKGAITMNIMETLDAVVREEGKIEGKIEGAEQKSYEFVSNLLAAGKFTVAEIANYATVSESFVKKVRADLANKKK